MFVIIMQLEKETKNTVKYAAKDEFQVADSIYLQKRDLRAQLGADKAYPQQIKLTIDLEVR